MISVVIPVFNRPRGASRAIGSVLAQIGPNLDDVEVIVVDDASEPPITFEGRDDRVRLIRLERNGGASAARNAGVRAAKGEVIAFLDSDDVWLPDKLTEQLSTLRRLEQERARLGDGLHAVVCGFYSPNRMTGRLQSRMPRPAATVAEFASGCWFCPGSALVIRRSAFESIGWLDERLRRLEDLDWFVRFGQAGGHLHVTSTFGCLIAPSYSGAATTIDDSARLIESKFGPAGSHALQPDAWRQLQAYLTLERGTAMLQGGSSLNATRQLLASFWHKPRLQPAVGPFWERSDEVPNAVAQAYADMLRSPR